MAKFWIKLYTEILHDPKMGQLSDSQWRTAIELFLMAGEIDQEGRLTDLPAMAWTLRRDKTELAQDLEALQSVGIISQDEQGFFVTRFSERQAPDSDAVRKARQRAASVTSPLQSGHEDVTDMSRESHADVTPVSLYRIDKSRVEENREEKNRIDNNDEPVSYTPLLNAYVGKLKCPVEYNPKTWVKPLVEMQAAGATPEDIIEAIDTLLKSSTNYKIYSPQSILKTVMSNIYMRNARNQAAQPAPYTPPPDQMIAIRRDHPRLAELVEGKAQ